MKTHDDIKNIFLICRDIKLSSSFKIKDISIFISLFLIETSPKPPRKNRKNKELVQSLTYEM